jgi:hypothetical protein
VAHKLSLEKMATCKTRHLAVRVARVNFRQESAAALSSHSRVTGLCAEPGAYGPKALSGCRLEQPYGLSCFSM